MRRKIVETKKIYCLKSGVKAGNFIFDFDLFLVDDELQIVATIKKKTGEKDDPWGPEPIFEEIHQIYKINDGLGSRSVIALAADIEKPDGKEAERIARRIIEESKGKGEANPLNKQ